MNKPPRRNEVLRQARLERNWTQRHLAHELGVGKQTVQSWERGTRNPSLELRLRLCALLSKTPEQLGFSLDGKDEQISHQVSLSPLPLGTAQLPVLQENRVIDHETLPLLPEIPRSPVINLGNENRQRMVKRVHSRWITGVLEHSLYHATLITLGLEEQPDAVENPWRLVVQESNLPPRLLPAGTRITQVYDDAHGELLILGEPGAGKTTLLLELARDLLDRAQADQSHPIPVIFSLSSWAVKQQPLAEWLVEELHTKYRVPLKVGQAWIETNHLLVLLDGLDEVVETARSACVKAINAYQQAYELVPIVICCRREEYFVQATRVVLQQAVLVQPLTQQQIDEYLRSAGQQLEAVRHVLSKDPEFREMVKTPLMLSIVALAYQGDASGTVVTAGSIEVWRQQVFATYVQRMLSRRGAKMCYSKEQTVHWLVQAEKASRRKRKSLTSGLVNGLTSGGISGVFCGLLFFGESGRLNEALPRGLGFGLFSGLIVGLLSALVAGYRVEPDQERSHSPPEVKRIGWITHLVDGLVIGLCAWLGFGVVNGLLVGLGQGITYGAIVGLLFGATFSFGGGISLIRGLGAEIKPAETVGWNWQNVRRNLATTLGKGLTLGLSMMVVVMVVIGIASGLFYGPAYGAAHGFVYGPIVGLTAGVASILTGMLNSGWSSDRLDERQLVRPNEGIRRSARNSLFAGCLFGAIGGLASGLAFGLVGRLAGWPILGTGFAIVLGMVFALQFAMIRGGIACIEHYLLRWRLWRLGSLPWQYVRFLDYATERILLRKVGGGYMFAHRLLLEYFAALPTRGEVPTSTKGH